MDWWRAEPADESRRVGGGARAVRCAAEPRREGFANGAEGTRRTEPALQRERASEKVSGGVRGLVLAGVDLEMWVRENSGEAVAADRGMAVRPEQDRELGPAPANRMAEDLGARIG